MNRFVLNRLREQQEERTMKEQEEKPVQHIQTQNNNYGCVLVSGGTPVIHIHNNGKKQTIETEQGEMPEELTSDKAKALLGKFQEAEMLDENFQPVDISTYGMAVLANEISKKLWKENRWKPFETLWNVNKLASKYDRALGMGKTSGLIDKIRDIIKG